MRIEKNVPMPECYKNGKQIKIKYPLHKMEIGDSILIPAKTKEQKYKITKNICTVWVNYVKRHNLTIKFTTKAEKNGIRLWRTV